MTPLFGLVLAGGRSRRMGIPKESLLYRGKPEAQRIYDILDDITDRAYYSIRVDQAWDPVFAGGRRIIDRTPGDGPLGALWSAFRTGESAGWLIVPTDMPFLDSAELMMLIEARQREAGIVAYDDGGGGFLTLPAIYEAKLSDTVMAKMGEGRKAIVGLGDETEIIRVLPGDQERLMNINTPKEKTRVMEELNGI